MPTVAAQDITLDGIVIESATLTPTAQTKVGATVDIVTRDQIEAQSQPFVVDYLEQLPGVSINQTGGRGSTGAVQVRGATSRYVKTIVDGIDISDPSATQTSTAFENLLVGDVARIELLKGSQSGLYGGNAVGGVISIDSVGADKQGVWSQGFAEYGRYRTGQGAVSAGVGGDDGFVAFTVQGVSTDGFSAADERDGNTEDDGYENITGSGRGEWRINDTVSVFFAARAINADVQFDGFPPPIFALADSAEETQTRLRAGRVGTNITLLDGAFENTFAVQGLTNSRENSGSNPSQFDGDRVKAEYKGVYDITKRLQILGGADYEETGIESPSITDRETRDLFGYFGQVSYEPIDDLVVTAAGRVDDDSAFGQFNTYRLTGAYLFRQTDTKFRASISTGYRAPSLFELFDPAFGNPSVDPEESDSWDIGVDQGFNGGKQRLSVTYFELDTENLISFDNAFRPINIDGSTERSGVEILGVAEVMPGVSVTAGYTFTATETDADTRLIRVPRHVVTLGLNAKPTDKLDVSIRALIVGDTLDTDFSTFPSANVALENYVLLDAKVAYEFSPGVKAYVRGDNLLDEDYQTVLGYGTPGASVFAGIQFELP